MKEEYDNFLLNELQIKISGGKHFLSIDSKNKPTVYNNDIYRAWMELYKSPEFKDVAVDLVKYAYSQSGMQNNLNQFFTHIPHEILSAEGIKWDVRSIHRSLKDSSMDEDFRDQFFRHNYDDPKIVPRVSGKNVVKLEGMSPVVGFLYNPDSEGNSISTGANERGIPTWPQFAARSITPDETRPDVTDQILYEYIGSVKRGDNYQPAYARTYKLGTKSRSGSIVEYQYGERRGESVVVNNNPNFAVSQAVMDFNESVSSDPTLIPASVLIDAVNKAVEKKMVPGSKVLNESDIDDFNKLTKSENNKNPDTFFGNSTVFAEFYNESTGKKEKMPQDTIWKLNNDKLYDMIYPETGEVIIENVELSTGFQYIAKANKDLVEENLDQIIKDKDINCE